MSVCSCLIRNDYNVIFAFFILMILNKFYINNTSFFTKLIIHILLITAIADIVWVFVMMSFWGTSLPKNEYWNGLSGIHTFGLLLGFLEIALKGAIIAYLRFDYIEKNKENGGEGKYTLILNISSADLWKFNYNYTKSSGGSDQASGANNQAGNNEFKNEF